MVRSDYQRQMERHAGHSDVLPHGLPVPSLPHGTDWSPGKCHGVALLTGEVLRGNRWPAVSGALLAELARRCATLGGMTSAAPDRALRPRGIEVRFLKAIPVADPRGAPHVADGGRVLYWSASAEPSGGALRVAVRMERRLEDADRPQHVVDAQMAFDLVEIPPGPANVERRMSEYLLHLPKRLVLPAYHAGWTSDEIRGSCRELPGSLLAAAEQALADAGKIIRGDGTPPGEEESMLMAAMTYRWVENLDDGSASYVARPGERRRDEKGRDWVEARAELAIDDAPVGEATGSLVFRRYRPENGTGRA